MPKKKKKNRKTKAQKRFGFTRGFAAPERNLSGARTDFHEFTQDFLDYMSKTSNAVTESEIQEELEKACGICTLAWNLSLDGGTYEKSIEELNSLAMKESDLSARMAMKFMLIQAFRILFSLPADEESLVRAAVDILTPEELECFYEKIDLNGLDV